MIHRAARDSASQHSQAAYCRPAQARAKIPSRISKASGLLFTQILTTASSKARITIIAWLHNYSWPRGGACTEMSLGLGHPSGGDARRWIAVVATVRLLSACQCQDHTDAAMRSLPPCGHGKAWSDRQWFSILARYEPVSHPRRLVLIRVHDRSYLPLPAAICIPHRTLQQQNRLSVVMPQTCNYADTQPVLPHCLQTPTDYRRRVKRTWVPSRNPTLPKWLLQDYYESTTQAVTQHTRKRGSLTSHAPRERTGEKSTLTAWRTGGRWWSKMAACQTVKRSLPVRWKSMVVRGDDGIDEGCRGCRVSDGRYAKSHNCNPSCCDEWRTPTR